MPIIAEHGIDAAIAEFERLEAVEGHEGIGIYSMTELAVLGLGLASEGMAEPAQRIFGLYLDRLPESPCRLGSLSPQAGQLFFAFNQ